MFIIVQVHYLMVLFSSVLINYRQYLGIIFLIIIVMLLSLLGEYFRYTTYIQVMLFLDIYTLLVTTYLLL